MVNLSTIAKLVVLIYLALMHVLLTMFSFMLIEFISAIEKISNHHVAARSVQQTACDNPFWVELLQEWI